MAGTSGVVDAAPASGHVAAKTNGIATKAAPKINGVHPPPEDPLKGHTASAPVSQMGLVNGKMDVFSQLPPEIEHITLGYRPISMLVGRLVQETFNSLEDIIGDMVEIPILQQQPNGVSNHINNRQIGGLAADSSQPNVKKKTRFFEWIHMRRAQFIKTLVLSKWARQAESLSKVIDLRIWLVQRQTDYGDAAHWIGLLKRNLASLKQHDPDISTALEVLALGRASWIPDLGYLPPEQMTPKQMLDGLHRINALLSIRLNLHETLPPFFRSFSIASGRATFRIPDECEVDLSIADEDIAKQLYFVDLRLTFNPVQPQIPSGRLRDEMEFRANDILGRERLNGLCNYLHNQILTQKLLILRQQAYEMAKNHWTGRINVEPVRRAVVVQYWTDKPGLKSWIEIGVKREALKLQKHTDREAVFSGLSLRWFRNNEEIRDAEIDIRPGDLSMQYILEQVIARHTALIMSELASRLRCSAVYSAGKLRLKISADSAALGRDSLLVQLTGRKAVKLALEPVSGAVSVQPSSELSARTEHELNRLPSIITDGASVVLQMRSRAIHHVVEGLASRIGWVVSRAFKLDASSFQNLFPKGTQQARYYRRQSWHPDWFLVFSTSPEGDLWWAVEGERIEASDSISRSNASCGYITALKIPQLPSDSSLEVSEASLLHIERTAIGIVSQYVDTRHLASMRIPHRIQANTTTSAIQRFPSLYLRLPMNSFIPSLLKSPAAPTLPWAHEVIKIDFQGLSSSHSYCVQRASCRVAPSFANLKELASNMKGAAFNSVSSAFTLQLHTKVGETSIPQLLHRIAGIGRLHEFVTVVKAQRLTLDTFSMGSMTFTYQQSPQILKASIAFPADSTMRLSLSAPNPHLRIVDHLNTTLRSQGLAVVISMLSVTQSLLAGLTQLEERHPAGDINIISRSEQNYQIRYPSSKTSGGFELQLKRRRDEYHWLIPEQTIKRPDPGFEEDKWRESLKPVTRGRGDGWNGVNGGIIATLAGVGDALSSLDAIFQESRRHVATEAPSTTTTKTSQAKAQTQTQTQSQPSRPGKRKAEGELPNTIVIG